MHDQLHWNSHPAIFRNSEIRSVTMGQIEELPDDFDESLDLNKQTPETQDAPPAKEVETSFPVDKERAKEFEKENPGAPKMPPAMEAVRSHTTDEIADMMNKTPLFMTDIDKAKDESMSYFPSFFFYVFDEGLGKG